VTATATAGVRAGAVPPAAGSRGGARLAPARPAPALASSSSTAMAAQDGGRRLVTAAVTAMATRSWVARHRPARPRRRRRRRRRPTRGPSPKTTAAAAGGLSMTTRLRRTGRRSLTQFLRTPGQLGSRRRTAAAGRRGREGAGKAGRGSSVGSAMCMPAEPARAPPGSICSHIAPGESGGARPVPGPRGRPSPGTLGNRRGEVRSKKSAPRPSRRAESRLKHKKHAEQTG
jgi:hypothetical protein